MRYRVRQNQVTRIIKSGGQIKSPSIPGAFYKTKLFSIDSAIPVYIVTE